MARDSQLRSALVLLVVTSIKVSELLPLKMEQVQTLFVDHWISSRYRQKSYPIFDDQ